MAKEMMYGEAIATAIIEEMQRDPNVIFYGQNMGMTERDPMLKMFGKGPHSDYSDFGNGGDGHGDWRGDDRLAAHRRIVDE